MPSATTADDQSIVAKGYVQVNREIVKSFA